MYTNNTKCIGYIYQVPFSWSLSTFAWLCLFSSKNVARSQIFFLWSVSSYIMHYPDWFKKKQHVSDLSIECEQFVSRLFSGCWTHFVSLYICCIRMHFYSLRSNDPFKIAYGTLFQQIHTQVHIHGIYESRHNWQYKSTNMQEYPQ